jgi:hypothetical protein
MTTNVTTTINVDSSMIDFADYNHETNDLLVQFKNTKTKYIYINIPLLSAVKRPWNKKPGILL